MKLVIYNKQNSQPVGQRNGERTLRFNRENGMNTFYMVFVEGCATPACKHDSLDSAEKEAKRLATLLKKKAYVLCTIKSVEDTQYKIEDCRPGESDLPF